MRFLAVFLLVQTLLFPAYALQGEVQQAEFSSARLIVGGIETQGENDATVTTAQAGLDITLKDGWKTYWRSPGDAGFPLTIEPADAATNIESVSFDWPYPHRFVEEWGLEVFGFKHGLLVPVTLTLTDPSAETQAVLDIGYAVCSDICINEQQQVSVTIPAGFAGDAAQAKKLEQARADVPLENGGHGMTITDVRIREEAEDKGVLAVTVTREAGRFDAPELFIETPMAGLRFPKADEEAGASAQEVVLTVPYEISTPAKTLEGQDITLTLVDNGKAIEHSLTVPEQDAEDAVAAPVAENPTPAEPEVVDAAEASATPEAEGGNDVSLATMLLLAVLGGLILNIMPCVLPVLSIKLLGAVKHGGGNTREVRQSFLATVAGILAFFMLLAGLTIATKHAGQAVGWGFHFQSAEFLTFLTVLILLFAANLLGMFEIQLPSWLNTHIYDVTAKGTLKHRHHLVGDFAMGAFAALMATPCTAPFLGTAIGFALARGDSEILLIFLALGVGLAVPYLAAAAMPGLATRLPKPGAWMLRVKQLMGALMLLAGLWLLWVIAGQTAPWVAAGVLLLSALLGAVLHGGGRWRFLRRKRVVALVCGVLLVSLALLPSFQLTRHQEPDVVVNAEELWQGFNQKRIATDVAAGKVVFVDVTADWCLTCKFNKLRVLTQDDVLAALAAEDVVAMQADMTRPMPDIQQYLEANGRYGIPFNIVYGPAAPEGIPLSEVLAVEDVLAAISKARGE